MLRQLPETVGPLTIGVVYLAAAAEARVGGDLYEVVATSEHGIRMIIGDVRGKGLEAVEVAADIIGRFRELAHSVHTLDEIAYRLDAGLTRRWGKHEEFVTALLAQVDPERGRLTILNAATRRPSWSPPDGEVTVLEVRAPAPPLGLITLGNDSGAKRPTPSSPTTSCSSTPTASPRPATRTASSTRSTSGWPPSPRRRCQSRPRRRDPRGRRPGSSPTPVRPCSTWSATTC